MGPYGAASAIQAINITLHRERLSCSKCQAARVAGRSEVLRRVLHEERPWPPHITGTRQQRQLARWFPEQARQQASTVRSSSTRPGGPFTPW